MTSGGLMPTIPGEVIKDSFSNHSDNIVANIVNHYESISPDRNFASLPNNPFGISRPDSVRLNFSF